MSRKHEYGLTNLWKRLSMMCSQLHATFNAIWTWLMTFSECQTRHVYTFLGLSKIVLIFCIFIFNTVNLYYIIKKKTTYMLLETEIKETCRIQWMNRYIPFCKIKSKHVKTKFNNKKKDKKIYHNPTKCTKKYNKYEYS